MDKEIEIEDVKDDTTETSSVEFNIVVTSSDPTLELIASKFTSGDIIIPDYQRKFVWDIRRASLLIESFIIGLPVPQVFYYENEDGQQEVIDGQQRITAIAYFFEGYFGPPTAAGNRKEFRLTGLEQRRELDGLTFDALDKKVQRKLKNSTIRAVTVKQLDPEEMYPESVYHIFERLNTGGKPLNSQEIRNAVYRGNILSELNTLNMDENWRTIYGKADADPSQRDIELILRLFALFKNQDNYSPPMKDFLSREMASNKAFDEARAMEFKTAFIDTMQKISEINIDKPFRPRGILNAATLEAIMLVLMENSDLELNIDCYNNLIKDEEFLSAITSNTTNKDQLILRKSRALSHLFQ